MKLLHSWVAARFKYTPKSVQVVFLPLATSDCIAGRSHFPLGFQTCLPGRTFSSHEHGCEKSSGWYLQRGVTILLQQLLAAHDGDLKTYAMWKCNKTFSQSCPPNTAIKSNKMAALTQDRREPIVAIQHSAGENKKDSIAKWKEYDT